MESLSALTILLIIYNPCISVESVIVTLLMVEVSHSDIIREATIRSSPLIVQFEIEKS